MSDQNERPNVLLICTDHLSGLMLGAAGHPAVMTPTIDQFAQAGVRYTNAYSATPSCIPARRALMLGMSQQAHGLRKYQEAVAFPDEPTLAQCFRDAGYQAYGVGKLHVYPQRNRIGFDDFLVEDQGRHQLRDVPDGAADDYELFLADQGFAGQEYAHGMTQNAWVTRSWHLPERVHPINWAATQLCRFIRRRDPRKPSFWYLSFSAPHPPLTPLQSYMDLYRDLPVKEPATGAWSRDFDGLPNTIKQKSNTTMSPLARATRAQQDLSRRAFYATITHIDHQIRTVIGYLRENQLLDNTIIAFTSDHGHMAGEHGLWCMGQFYEMADKIPLIVVPARRGEKKGLVPGTEDARIAEFGDIMPTLLDLAGVPIPESVDRLSLAGSETRDYLYGEHGEGADAQRMVRKGDYKLIYYPEGNHIHLFNITDDPEETRNLANDASAADAKGELLEILKANLYGGDESWVQNGELVGLPERPFEPSRDVNLRGQRGLRFM